MHSLPVIHKSKVAIALSLAEQEMEGWDTLASQCSQRLAELEKTRQELEEKRTLLKESQGGSLKFYNITMSIKHSRLEHGWVERKVLMWKKKPVSSMCFHYY
jgi:hypothetical protein